MLCDALLPLPHVVGAGVAGDAAAEHADVEVEGDVGGRVRGSARLQVDGEPTKEMGIYSNGLFSTEIGFYCMILSFYVNIILYILNQCSLVPSVWRCTA